MKKITAVLLSFCLLIFSSCKQEDLININIFVKRFNNISAENIETKDIKAFEENENLIYNFLLYGNILLTLTCDKNTNRIKSCSITAKKNDFSKDIFRDCCQNMIIAFEKLSKKDAETVLKKFNFKETLFLEEGFFYYYFSTNDVSYFFNVDSKRLVEEYVTDQKLYE